jgi:hypothetical protein
MARLALVTLSFFLAFLLEVRITFAANNNAVPTELKIEKKTEKIEFQSIKREPQRKLKDKTRRKAVFKIDSETLTDRQERISIEKRKKDKNINDDVDSDFFSGSQELSSRDPSSVDAPVEPQNIPESLKAKFIDKVSAHWKSLKRYFFGK